MQLRPGLEFLYISGTGFRAKKNQGAKKTRSITKGEKRKERRGEGKEGVKQTSETGVYCVECIIGGGNTADITIPYC